MTGRAEIIEAATEAVFFKPVTHGEMRTIKDAILAALRAMHASDPARTVEDWIKEIEG